MPLLAPTHLLGLSHHTPTLSLSLTLAESPSVGLSTVVGVFGVNLKTPQPHLRSVWQNVLPLIDTTWMLHRAAVEAKLADRRLPTDD